jgi:putative transposase
MEIKYTHSYRSVYNLTAQAIFVTKYRKKILNSELLTALEGYFLSILNAKDCELIEFNGEPDHVHLILSYKPTILVSNLIANLKSSSSKQLWDNHGDLLKKTYWGKRVLWTGSYFVASCGGVTIEQLKKYVEQQNRPD